MNNVKPFLWPIFFPFSHNLPSSTPITGFHHLPEDVIIEILARLPVKSLLRFKRVCKSWYALTKTPSFVSRHLSFTPLQDTHVVINHWNHVTKGGFVSFLLLSNEQPPVNKLITRDVPISFFGDDVNVNLSEVFFYGPCNGVICVLGVLNHSATYSDHGGPRAGDLIALWNPATREIKRLSSDSSFSCGNDFKTVKVDIGFGFDVKSNDYKVVRILNFWRNVGKYLVEVYDLRTGSWRKIDAVIPTTMLVNRAFSTYLNGFYYWWSADENVKSVLSFDFEKEVFESIPAPPDLTVRSYVTLVNYNGSVALVAHDSSNLDFVVVWVLNKDGDKKTWTKLFNIMPDCFRFVGFSRIGAFYLVNGGANNHFGGKKNLVLYKPSTGQLTKLKLRVYEHTCSQLVNYAESLVSFM